MNEMHEGDVVGELAFFREAGQRTATVRALGTSRVLVLRYRFLDELRKKDPKSAYLMLFHLGRVLADRLEERTQDAARVGA